MLEWLVLADDRTGALEVAGEMAMWLGPVTVTVGSAPGDAATATVVDLASRHCSPSVAAGRATLADAPPARRRAHKIDSLLRGNWAAELVAVQRATGDRTLLVPALPRLGRICVGGIVLADGEPVGAGDARQPIASPRAADHLAAAGAGEVAELADVDALRCWLHGGGPFAICDASGDDDLASIAEAWREVDGVRFAGTAGSIAAAVAATCDRQGELEAARLDGDALVVCGSLHPVARAQIEALDEHSDSQRRVTVLASPLVGGTQIAAGDAERAAAELAVAARELIARRRFAVLVLVGGDTAAAVLGDEPMVAGGTVRPGVPWSRRGDGSGPLVVTKAGGFGDRTTLTDLLAAGARSAAR